MRRRSKQEQVVHKRAYMHRYLRQHRKERAAYERKYRSQPEVKAKRRTQARAYYRKNIEKKRAYQKEYRKRPEAIKLNRMLQARYRATPHAKEVRKKYEQTAKRKRARGAYYLNNREHKLEMMRKYYFKNREKIWERRRLRIARKKAS